MIFYRGDDAFAPSAPPEWNQQLFDLDTLVEKYRGGRENLDVFLDSLKRFQPSATDPNMFLVNWHVSGGTNVFPEVSLNFSGKKNGILPFGRKSTETKTLTAEAATPFGPISIVYRARTPVYEWVSKAEGDGALSVPDVVSSPTARYFLYGYASIGAGSDILVLTGASTEVRVGDRISFVLQDPTKPISVGTAVLALVQVTAILGGGKFRISPVVNYIRRTWTVSTVAAPIINGIHISNLGVTVVSMRIGCGITSIAGAATDLIGPILVTNYFRSLITPDLSATEVVPDRYWKNRQEIITSLLPLPC